jgi:anti-sigma regulatory factor (Ser/Thr protein kinase)
MTRTLMIERDARAPGKARRALDELAPALDERLVPNAALLLSELMTNAVKYGTGPIGLRLEAGAHGLRCDVADQGAGFTPKARSAPATQVGGWGLYLVEELASAWGVRDGSTHVWFELAVPED